MSFPVLEQITQNIATTLAAITVANGYAQTLIVERAMRMGNIPTHRKLIIHELSPDEVEVASINIAEWIQNYAIEICIRPDESDTTPTDQYINYVIADVTKALRADVTRGGKAIDTTPRAPIFFTNVNGETDGVDYMLEVRYRHNLNNPYLSA